jgi:hypothetical protein
MNELLKFLLQGPHPVIASRVKSVDELKRGLDQGYLLVRFTDSDGETELSLRVLPENVNSSSSDTIYIAGDLILDYTKVRCEIDLQLPAMDGVGTMHIA